MTNRAHHNSESRAPLSNDLMSEASLSEGPSRFDIQFPHSVHTADLGAIESKTMVSIYSSLELSEELTLAMPMGEAVSLIGAMMTRG